VRESTFNTEVVNSLKAEGFFAYKIPDTPASIVRGLRYSPEKPCDIVASIGGKFVAIESKQIKKIQAFGLRDFRESQIDSLNKIVRDGGKAYAFLNIRVHGDKEFKRLNLLVGLNWKYWYPKFEQGFKLDAKFLRDMLRAYHSNKFYASTLGELAYNINISEGYKGIFDIRFLND
jgi:Holliday junction resolvase